MLDPKRSVAELRELQELTGDENGAQRVAWTDTWVKAQEWMAGKLDGIEMEFDEARNQWWTLPGDSERTLIVRGRLDGRPGRAPPTEGRRGHDAPRRDRCARRRPRPRD